MTLSTTASTRTLDTGTTVTIRDVVRCPLCGHTNFITVLDARDFESGSGDYTLKDCGQCGALFTSPQVIDSDIPKLYETRSTADFNPADKGPISRFITALRRVHIRRQIKRAVADLGLKDPFTAVDIGCGDGLLATILAEHPLCQAVNATDFATEAPPRIKEAEIPYYSFENFTAREGAYDLVFCRHVLEHVSDPKAFVRAASDYLKPGGHMVVEVPNYDTVWLRLLGEYYSILYVPRHMHMFTNETLRAVFEHGQTGFEVKRISRAHSPAIWRSVGYALGRKWSNVGLIGVALYPLQVGADMIRGGSTTLVALVKKSS